MSCEYLNNDGSCGEPEYAWCMAWTKWNHEHPERKAIEFCELSEEERDKYEK